MLYRNPITCAQIQNLLILFLWGIKPFSNSHCMCRRQKGVEECIKEWANNRKILPLPLVIPTGKRKLIFVRKMKLEESKKIYDFGENGKRTERGRS